MKILKLNYARDVRIKSIRKY